MNISLPTWLDMDQPVEAAVAAIVLFLVAGYFLRGRPPERPPEQAPIAPVPTPEPLAPPSATPPLAPARTIDPVFQEYLDYLGDITPAPGGTPEGVPRAAHWSD